MKPNRIGKSCETWKEEFIAWCHCSAVYPIDINFLQNFDGLAHPLFEFVSIFCQISSLRLQWKKWNFCGKTGSQSLGGGSISQLERTTLNLLLLLLDAPHFFSPLLVHCVNAGAVVRFLRQKALVAPPLFPSKPHSTAGSRTIKITNSGQNLGLGHLYNSIIQVSNVRLSEDYFG